MLPVARSLPELAVVHVWRHDLLEPPLPVLAANELRECVVYEGPSREEETAPGT